jgi:capsular exopolysaccharide synthesis family protein
MSRVEEARRRAEGRDVDDHRAHPTPSFASEETDEALLQGYPPERRPVERVTVNTPHPVAAPRATLSKQMRALAPSLDGKLVGGDDTPTLVVEQYRRLAASLHQLQADTGLKTMMVTSATPREGKTLTIANLALTLSGSYRRRVLLIDADLRRPSLHEVFRLPQTSGLSEALRSGIRPHLLELSPFLSVLPAGHLEGDPLSALTSERLPALVEQCTTAFDWVLLDAPPIGLMPDGNVLARLAKAVVFVIAADLTPHSTIERAIAEIGRDTIVGIVLNRIDLRQMPSGSDYNEYYSSSAAAK